MQAIAGRDRDAGIAGLSQTDPGCPSDRDQALAPGVDTFLAPQTGKLEDAGEVDVVFDVIGGHILARSAALVRAGGTLVTIAMPPKVIPRTGGPSFSSSNPTACVSPTSPRG